MDESSWEDIFNGSPVRRAGFLGIRRNIAIAMGNAAEAGSGGPGFVPRLREWAESADEGLRTAARWALSKLVH
jgi:epoxyqueuosine reductase